MQEQPCCRLHISSFSQHIKLLSPAKFYRIQVFFQSLAVHKSIKHDYCGAQSMACDAASYKRLLDID